jgi:hypothetical protein
MTESNRHAPTGAAERAPSLAAAGPYAGPRRNTPTHAGQDAVAAHVPYVPAPFRGKPRLARHDDGANELPSISEFLSTPARNDALTSPLPASERASSGESAAAGQWPLEEAGAELQRIGDLFESPTEEPPGLFEGALDDAQGNAGSKTSKPMWRTDEWMDIMPVSPENAGHVSPSAEHSNDAHRAADALDAIVQRVRNGEISISGFHDSMSDATLLAALLTSMLGRGR